VRLYSRPGNDLAHRFPLIVERLAACGTFTRRWQCTKQLGACFMVSHGAGLDFLCKHADSGKMPTHRKN
jgi:hypothetical protein